jgi:type II secretory pathway component GspD/PulD (secretin)
MDRLISRLASVAFAAIAIGVAAFFARGVSAQQTPTLPGPVPSSSGAVYDAVGVSAQGQIVNPNQPAAQAPGKTEPAQKPASDKPAKPIVRTLAPDKVPPAVSGQKGPYEPYLNRPIQYIPAPAQGQTLTLRALQSVMPASEFLDTLAEATGWNILPTPEAAAKQLNFSIKEMNPAQALEVLHFHGIYYEFDAETNYLYVMTRDQHLQREFGAVETKEYTVRYADLNDMTASLSTLLSANGRMIPDPRTGRLLVMDTKDNLAAISDALKRLDTPLEPHNFYLKHVNAESIAESIQALLSERGVAFSDPRMNVLSVTDLPSRMQQVESLVAALDVPQVSRTWTLSYQDPKDVAERLEAFVPEEMGSISLDELVHQVTVTAIPERIEQIDALIKDWDVPRRQVQIEVYLVLASMEFERNFGIDWSYFDDANGNPIAISNGGSTPDFTARPEAGQLLTFGTLPIPRFDFNPFTGQIEEDINGDPVIEGFRGSNISVVLNYLDQQGDASILSRPRVTVYDGEKAVFQNTEERPYQDGGYSQYGGISTDPSFNRLIPLTVQFIEVGTILKVMPRINDESKILMEIDVEDSTAQDVTVITGDQRSTIPQKTKANAKTRVLVHDTQTIVIGGLRNVSTDDSVDKVPFLGDVPFVGRLFKSTEKTHKRRELLVFITPTIVDPYTTKESVRLSRFDHDVEEKLRQDGKGLFKRSFDSITKKENELTVSVGQGGDVMVDGEPSTIEMVHAKIETHPNPKTMTVVVLEHPLAPDSVVTSVVESAGKMGMKVRNERQAFPFVPTYQRKTGNGEVRQK